MPAEPRSHPDDSEHSIAAMPRENLELVRSCRIPCISSYRLTATLPYVGTRMVWNRIGLDPRCHIFDAEKMAIPHKTFEPGGSTPGSDSAKGIWSADAQVMMSESGSASTTRGPLIA